MNANSGKNRSTPVERTANVERATYSIEEWSKLYGVSRNYGYIQARAGKIPGLIRIGNRMVISKAVADAVLAGGTEATTA